jgi:hypothetical protein
MRLPLALIFLLHGLAHLVGFAGAFRLKADIPYKTTVFLDTFEVGDRGIRVFGVLWLAMAALFATAAVGFVLRTPWAHPFAVGVTIASLILCATALPEAKIGLVLNAVLLLLLALAPRFGWL